MDIEDSDHTGWLSRLIRVFAGSTGHFVGYVVLWLINVHIPSGFVINIELGLLGVLLPIAFLAITCI